MKIGLIFNHDECCREHISSLGKTQAGYLIQRALYWFRSESEVDLLGKVRIFTSQHPSDLWAAAVASDCLGGNHFFPIETIDSGWGYGKDQLSNGESKVRTLANRIVEKNTENCLVFAYFDPTHNLETFLGYWSISLLPDEWPNRAPVLVCLETQSKTMDLEIAPFY